MKFYFIVCFLVFASCSGNRQNKIDTDEIQRLPVVKIEPPRGNRLKSLLLSEIADSIHYVALETNKNCLVSPGIGFSINSGFLFLQGQLLFFSPEGKFLNPIGSIGRGPEEYLPTTGSVVDEQNGIVYVRDRGRPNAFVQYFLDGKYKGVVKNDFVSDGARAVSIDSAIIMVYPVMDNRYKEVPDIVVYNPIIDSVTATRTIDFGIERVGYHFDFSSSICFSVHPKYAYYKSVYCDTLYMITKNGIIPAMILDFGKHTFSKENIYERRGWSFTERFRNTTIPIRIRRVENSFYFHCVYRSHDDRTTSFIYVCNLDGQNGAYYQSVFINDLDDGPDYRFPEWGDITSVVIDNIDDENRFFYFPSNNMPKKMKRTDQFTDFYNKARISDNPIIQVIHYKKM